jgi:hypothetical protein
MPGKPTSLASKVWKILLLLGLFIVATYLAGRLGKTEKSGLPGPSATVPTLAAARDIELVAGLSQSSIEVGKPARFWLTVRNRSSQPITDVSVEPSGLSAFHISSRCWKPPLGAASCVPTPAETSGASSADQTSAGPAPDVVVPSLAQSQTVSVWGELTANTHQGKQTLFVTVRWLSPDEHRSQYVIPLGMLEAQDREDQAKEVWAAIVGFYKDLALPLLLAVLAYLFKRWDDARERVRQKAENERQQIMQTLLPASLEDATKYYMPLAAASRESFKSFKKCQEAIQPGQCLPANSPLVKQSLYYFLLTMRRFRSISRERGGLYFKDRVGERIASLCISEMFRLYLRDLPDLMQHTSVVLSNIKPFEVFGEFILVLESSLAATASRTPLQESYLQVHTGFYAWISTSEFRDVIPLLKSLATVLEFEMNRPYESWYPEAQKERLKLEEDEKNTLKKLAARAQKEDDSYESLPGELEDYFTRGQALENKA